MFLAESGTPLQSHLSWKGGTVYFNGRGDLGRTPALSQIDVLVQHDFRPLHGRRLTLGATITNLLDQATPTLFTTNPWRDTFGLDDAVFFGGFDPYALAAQIRAAGGTMRDNPLHLKPSGFQARRSIRLGAKLYL